MTGARLIVTADDFGRSASVNQAVIQAHREGILTCASLMVTGEAAAEAVALARQHPGLGVGLHLTLVQGRPALDREALAGLVDGRGRFLDGAVQAGWRYWWRRSLREPLRREIAAQFGAFGATGLRMDHVNGHLHLHLHPVILPLVLEEARRHGVRGFRCTNDPFWHNARLASGRWAYRLSHAIIFHWLSRRVLQWAAAYPIRTPRQVFGLLQDGRVDTGFLCRLVRSLPAGDFEVYSHPSMDRFRHEWEALRSDEVREAVRERAVELIRYEDL